MSSTKVDEDVSNLKKELSQCQYQREQLLKEINELKLLEKKHKQALENIMACFETVKEDNMKARSEFTKNEELLTKELEAKELSNKQLQNEVDNLARIQVEFDYSSKYEPEFKRLCNESDNKTVVVFDTLSKTDEKIKALKAYLKNVKVKCTVDVDYQFHAYVEARNRGEDGQKVLMELIDTLKGKEYGIGHSKKEDEGDKFEDPSKTFLGRRIWNFLIT